MSKIVEIARLEIGTVESPKNSNKTKYGVWFGYNGVPWCAEFVSWCYYHAGYPLEPIGFKKGFAGCQTAVAHFKKTNQITKNPQPGDIVFFDWNGDGRYDHTGIFERSSINNKSFYSIEGNTSLSNNSNGGEVMLRTRSYKNCIFVHTKILNEGNF